MKSPGIFALVYVLLMIPTYILPYFGSNSYAAKLGGGLASEFITAAGGASGAALAVSWIPFILHLGCFIGLIAIAVSRGNVIGKKFLVVFPILAGLFDLMPVINWIPLVPTVFHIVTLVVGIPQPDSKRAA